jgi:hypothetical protein
MNRLFEHGKRVLPALLLVIAILATCGCASVKVNTENLPPVLAQDELLRPYHKVGVIEVNRDRYGSPADLTPADYSWANASLQKEAAKIGADAVILPEVRVEIENYLGFPKSFMRAKGIAIKFD